MVIVDFHWVGGEVECYHKQPVEQENTYYKSFYYNGETYNADDFAVMKTAYGKEKICKLLELYETAPDDNMDSKFRGTVRWYTKAVDIPMVYKNGIELDKDNEIIEDCRNLDVLISLEELQRKCNVVFAAKEDPVYLIDKMGHDKDIYFSCRYKIAKNQLTSLLSELDFEQTALNDFDCTPNNKYNQLNKNKLVQVNVVDTDLSKGISQTVKITPQSLQKLYCSNVTPNRAKRNLNESFDNTPNSQADSPILNYSVVEQDVDDNKSIKIKLRLSDKQKYNPKVVLKRLDLDIVKNSGIVVPKKNTAVETTKSPKVVLTKIDMNLIKNNEETPQKIATPNKIELRRSSRTTVPVSYVDYELPRIFSSPKSTRTDVGTPSRRTRSKSIDVRNMPPSTPKSTKKKTVPTTPKSKPAQLEMTPSKKRRSTSVGIEIMQTPPKKNSTYRTPKKEEPHTSPNKRNRTISCDSDVQIISPRKKAAVENYTPQKVRTRKVTIKDEPEENLRPKSTRRKKLCEIEDDLEHILSPLKLESRSRRGSRLKSHEMIEEDLNLQKMLFPLKLDFNTKDAVDAKATPTRKSMRKKSIDNEIEVDTFSTPKKATQKVHKNTPGTRKKSIDYENESENYNTPKKTAQKIPKTPKNTPGMRMKLIRDGVITPSMQSRQTAVVKDNTPLNIAKIQLHVSYVPTALPCREKEFSDILGFVEGKLLDGCGGCMYISGVPGTGKTATVTEVIKNLQEMSRSKKLPNFSYVSINGMRLTEPRQSYVEIHKQLTGKTVPWEQAQTTLENRFTKSSKTKTQPIVLLVDELDILCTKRQDVVYNLLDWPTKAKNQLIVITIANTMDLPERLLMGRVTSRLGLTRLTFQAYTHKQLQEIVMKRLMGTNAFNPDAVQLVARKVASVSGDARRALDICRRAAEIAEVEGPKTLVSMKHVNEALGGMITQPKVRAIKHCSRLEQLILQAIVAEVERTGVDETTFSDIYTMLLSVAGIDGFHMVSSSLALAAVSRLGACRLLLTDQKSNDLFQKLILNVSADDIYYALRKDS